MPSKLKKLGIFNAKEAQSSAGIGRHTLSRWVKQEKLLRIDRGLYMHPKSSIDPEELDFAMAYKYFGPDAAVSGLSALFHYGLIDQAPQQVWLIVPQAKKNERKKYKCLRTSTPFTKGIEDRGCFKITNIERTLIESLKFATKLGLRIAINATRRALKDDLTTETKLGKMATALNLKKTFDKYWEAIIL